MTKKEFYKDFKRYQMRELDLNSDHIDMLLENPYWLYLQSPKVFTLEFCDTLRIRHNINHKRIGKYRFESIVNATLLNNIRISSSTKVSWMTLVNELIRYGYKQSDIITELNKLANKIVFIRTDDKTIQSYSQYEIERDIITYLKNLIPYDSKDKIDIPEYLNKEQKQAIINAIESPISIITGSPGTGKSTVIQHIINNFENRWSSLNVCVMTPTGKASLRLTKDGVKSKTIHSSMGALVAKDHRIIGDVFIIDEFSMVTTDLLYQLLKLVHRKKDLKRIIFIGDVNQLPAIGTGWLLGDFINSKKFPTVTLTQNYRQADSRAIIDDCELINKSQLPKLNTMSCKGYQMSEIEAINKIVDHYIEMTKHYGNDHTQILCPMYKGACGINNINAMIQQQLFRYNKYVSSKFSKYYVGDKVMCVKNNYKHDIFNGEFGTVVSISDWDGKNYNQEKMVVKYGKKHVEYVFGADSSELPVLAYAISIHKSQGSEFNEVILCLFNSTSWFLNKKILYTGLSRAKNKAMVFYEERALHKSLRKETNIPASNMIWLIDSIMKEGNINENKNEN